MLRRRGVVQPSRFGEKRNLLCPRYSECLLHVAKMNWGSFGCERCSFFNVENRKEIDGYSCNPSFDGKYPDVTIREVGGQH